jgi:predicted HTH transcriptional regulator
MLDPHKEIHALVDNFVADLSELAKRIAIEQIKTAFSVGAKLAPSAVSPAPTRGSRARRGQREIEALRGKVLAAIAERPGRRAEDLNSTLGTKTPQIAQLLRKLVADELVRTEGARRGTRYFAVGTGGPADAPSGRRPAPEAPAAAEEPAS